LPYGLSDSCLQFHTKIKYIHSIYPTRFLLLFPTPLVIYSFSPLPFLFHPSPCSLRSIFLPLPFSPSLSLPACIRSSHCPRVTSCTFSLSSFPPMNLAIIFLSHTHFLPSLMYFDSLILSLLFYLYASLSLYLFIHLLLVHFLAGSSSSSLLLLEIFLQFLLSLSHPI
jgi:hypothetical protein